MGQFSPLIPGQFAVYNKNLYFVKLFDLNAVTDDDVKDFANLAAGHSLAEIENILTLAINRAVETNTIVTIDVLNECFEETVYGEERQYSKDHLLKTARHEAGHAFMGFICDDHFFLF